MDYKDLKDRFNTLKDFELINIMEKEFGDYTVEAQKIAETEVEKRGGIKTLRERVKKTNLEWDKHQKEKELLIKKHTDNKSREFNLMIVLSSIIVFLPGLYFSIISVRAIISELFGDRFGYLLLKNIYNIPSYTKYIDILIILIAITTGILLILSALNFIRLRKNAILMSKISLIISIIFIIYDGVIFKYKR
jgi:hypothetical protein